MLSDRCPVLSVCLSVTLVHCGQTVERFKMKLGVRVGLGPGHIVLDGDPARLPTEVEPPPQFLAHFYCGETAGCIKMPRGMEVGLSPRGFVLDGEPDPSSQKGGGAPNFRPTSIVAKHETSGWIKMALDMEVGLGPVHIVLDGDTAPLPKKGAEPPKFRPTSG